VSTSSRLRGQDGFIREVVWIVVILAVIAVVILDGMAIFNAYQTAGNTSDDAAQAALTEYAQTQNASAAKLAAEEQLSKNGLTMVGFKFSQTPEGTTKVTVTARDHADTYAFHFLGAIPPLKDWVERTTNPVRSASDE
jgi:Flp pilus assembly protein TadG